MDEKQLIERCLKGDLTAFETLVEQNQKRVFNIAFRLFGNAEDANDILQEVFIKVYRCLGNFKGNSTFSTWLYRITTNVALDELRKRNKHKVISLDSGIETDEGVIGLQLEDMASKPDELLEREELKKHVQKAIGQLSEEHRMVIILRDIEGLSYDEIANVLNCSMGTVKSRINRARNQLKNILSKGIEPFNIVKK